MEKIIYFLRRWIFVSNLELHDDLMIIKLLAQKITQKFVDENIEDTLFFLTNLC